LGHSSFRASDSNAAQPRVDAELEQRLSIVLGQFVGELDQGRVLVGWQRAELAAGSPIWIG